MATDGTITSFSGIDIQTDMTIPGTLAQPANAPRYTTAQIASISPDQLRNGGLVYNTDTNMYQVYKTYVTGAANVTTSAWVSLQSILSMTAVQGGFFEAVNTIPGQIYFRNDTNTLRIYSGSAAIWGTITTEFA